MPTDKLLVVHLSDIHIRTSTDEILQRTEQIAQSTFATLPQVDRVLIVASGDIAWSGTAVQYALAAEFISTLVSHLRRETPGTPIDVAVCPGNHDCNLERHDEVRAAVITAIRANPKPPLPATLIASSTAVQDEFFQFRDSVSTLPLEPSASRLSWRHKLIVGGKLVTVRCLNVAWMSVLKEKEGTLVFPDSEIEPLSVASKGLVLTVLHHPFNWFTQASYRPFRTAVRNESHLVFSGHEHSQNVGEVQDTTSSPSVFVEGGVLHESTSDASTFNIALLDLRDDQYSVIAYAWDGSKYNPDLAPSNWGSLRPLPEKGKQRFPILTEFSSRLDDPGATFSHSAKKELSMSDIFVWPEIKFSEDSAIIKRQVNASHFEAIENIGKGAFIRGEEKTGKTTLLLQYFRSFHARGYLPLYVRGNWIQRQSIREPERTLRFALGKQYNAGDIQAILHESRDKRVLLLDDVDFCSLSGAQMSECLENLFPFFGAVVITAKDGAEAFDMFSLEHVAALKDFARYELREFGHKKRYELVCRWAAIGSDNPGLSARQSMADIDKWEKQLNTAVGRQFVPSVPIFLLTLLQSIEGNRTADLQNSALGLYYQYLITSALERTGVKQDQWSEIFNYCSNLAWSIQNSPGHSFTEPELIEFNKTYSAEFTPVSFGQRLRHLLDAGVIALSEDAYRFRYPYLYYMFLGQYIAEHIHEEECQQLVDGLCQELHLRENANTLLFIGHYTRNPIVYERISETLAKCFADSPAFDFEKDVDLLNRLIDSAPELLFTDKPDEDMRATARAQQDRMDDQLADHDDDSYVPVEVAAITRLFRGMEILGQFLKNHYGTTRNPTKNQLVDALIQAALRGLHSLTESLRSHPEQLADYVEKHLRDGREDLQDHERKLMARQFVFDLTGWITFAFVQKAATCVGSEYLKPNVSEVAKSRDSVAYRVVEMGQQLDLAEPLPFDRLKALHKEFDKNMFATALLRSLALRHLHLFKVTFKDKQRLCSELGIAIERQLALERNIVK
jgi:hypothetical protein